MISGVGQDSERNGLAAPDNLGGLDLHDERAGEVQKRVNDPKHEYDRGGDTYSCGSIMQSGHSETVTNQSGTAPCCLRSKGRHLPSVLRLENDGGIVSCSFPLVHTKANVRNLLVGCAREAGADFRECAVAETRTNQSVIAQTTLWTWSNSALTWFCRSRPTTDR